MAADLRMFALVCALPLASCSPSAGTTGEAQPPASALAVGDQVAPAKTEGVVLGKIVTQDAKVSIVGGRRDLRIVIHRHDGALVADGLSLAELRAREPALYVLVTSAVAGVSGEADAKRASYVDATFDAHHVN
ncbi:MAG: hypothetical protein KF819_29890 [Labilithrix sp.]|nr:hypothetical protein [Labilithrix sp.]